MPTPSSELLRIDPLTECKNFLGFLETCLNISVSDLPRDVFTDEVIETTLIDPSRYSAILFVDLNDLESLNETKGRVYSDSVIHWMGILLREESNGPVFRLSGDEFAVLLKMEAQEEYSGYLERILLRMDQEARLLGLPGSPADLALILFNGSPATLDTVLLQMTEAMMRVKNDQAAHSMIFKASDFNFASQVPPGWKSETSSNSTVMRWLSYKYIYQVLEMGRSLDKTQQDAYTDAISNLPNMKAALLELEHTLQTSKAGRRPFSLLLIDGDNIRAYNSINYVAGDVMIRDLGTIFKNNLRPSDFVARWRTGDEFMVILPLTTIEGASIIGERFRLAVKEASRNWKFPVTISVGISSYPAHGENIDSLIDRAESANKHAKEQGKDRVVLAN
jgi:diguanylate cyclase (GGDEF)-like protein